jgi:hypothetical protein
MHYRKQKTKKGSIEGKVYMGVVSRILFWRQELAHNHHLRWCLCHPGSRQTTGYHPRGVETWPYLQVAIANKGNGESLSLFISLSTFSRFLVFHFGEHWIRLLRFENNFDLFGDLNVNSGSFVVNFGLLED